MGLMKLVLNTDPTADRGARSCYLGNLNLMREYEFNGQRPLSETLNADFYAHINASTGHMEVEISPFCPLRDLNPPAGAKYFQLFIRGAAVNSEGKHSERAIAPFLPITSDETDTINLNIKVNAQEGDIQALALGIIFYEEYMGAPSAMRNGSLALVQVARLDPQVLKATAHKPGYAPKSIDSAINTLGTTFKKAFRFNDPFGLAKDPVHAPAFKKAEEKLKQTLWHHQLQRYRRG